MKLSSYIILLFAIAVSLQMFSMIPKGEEAPELAELRNIFKNEMDSRGLKDLQYSDIRIKMVNEITFPSAVGLSFPLLNKRYVQILKDYYIHATPEVKEALVIHELGHTFGLDHDDRYTRFIPERFKCPLTVMHSYDDMSGCFTAHRSYYYDILAESIKRLDKRNNF